MRVLIGITALAFAVAPGSDSHPVTLRFDTVTSGQATKIDLKAPVAGLHLGNSSGPAQQQLTVTPPVSVVVDANVDALMIDAQNNVAVRVSFEAGGTPREQALRIVGTRMMLRRNMDGDLVMGARVLPAPGRP
jgi:hypothetical protein